jgi:hypothetical protein
MGASTMTKRRVMKRKLIIAALALLVACGSPLQFQPVAKAEEPDAVHKFVYITLGAMYAKQNCGTPFTVDSLIEYGDRIGADQSKLRPAIIAAMKANMGDPYEHADIIPAVTQNFLAFTDLLLGVSKDQACKTLLTALKNNGITK